MNDPGTQLKKLLARMDIHPTPDCPCIEHMEQMDEWGVVGCRIHFNTIIDWLVAGYKEWGWGAVIRYAAAGLMDGLAFQLNPFHPITSLVKLAIRNAESPPAGQPQS